MRTLIQFDKVCKSFGDKVVLRNFSAELPEKGVVALTGPSGCGKTTLLRLIAGLEKPDSGKVRMEACRKVSMVFQENRLIPSLTAVGNVMAVMSGDAVKNKQAADKILADLGLAGEEDRYPHQLSGGMNRRIALARAIAYGGHTLLLDEPFQALDKALRRRITEYLFGGGGSLFPLVLLVTHDEEEMKLAHTVLRYSGPPLTPT